MRTNGVGSQLYAAEIQRVDETADQELSPVALVYSDIADKKRTFFRQLSYAKSFFRVSRNW
jgi:hypothetical protein